MIKASKLSRSLTLRCDLQIAELKADFWVISHNGFPVGAIEVKKPGGGDDFSRNLGQLFDYMLRIRSFHGIRSVFGICTNFTEWNICWFPDSDSAAKKTSLDYPLPALLDTPISRILHVSQKYLYNSRELSVAITTVLKKMDKCAAELDPVPLISASRPYIVLTSDSWHWKNGLRVQLSLQPPPKSTKNFYLLRDFHGGADGRVWLACSLTGNIAVIKFQRRLHETETGDEQSRVNKEVKMWHECKILSVFAGKFSGRHAVVMPFGFHYTDNRVIDDRWWTSEKSSRCEIAEHFAKIHKMCVEMETATVLERCIERCAKAGIAHDDIEWRHTAIFPEIIKPLFYGKVTFSLHCAFIDLGRMKQFLDEPKDSRYQKAIAEMRPAKNRLLEQ
jgi:hypothetical protein